MDRQLDKHLTVVFTSHLSVCMQLYIWNLYAWTGCSLKQDWMKPGTMVFDSSIIDAFFCLFFLNTKINKKMYFICVCVIYFLMFVYCCNSSFYFLYYRWWQNFQCKVHWLFVFTSYHRQEEPNSSWLNCPVQKNSLISLFIFKLQSRCQKGRQFLLSATHT